MRSAGPHSKILSEREVKCVGQGRGFAKERQQKSGDRHVLHTVHVGCLQEAYVIVMRSAWEHGLCSQGHEYGVVKGQERQAISRLVSP